MEILFDSGILIAGLIIYYFEYKPVPKKSHDGRFLEIRGWKWHYR